MIFYEAPHKLCGTLEDLLEAFGPQRSIALCRELTKLHEEVLRMSLQKAVDYYREQAPRGEYVLIVAGAAPKVQEAPSLDQCLQMVAALRSQGSSLKDAVRQVRRDTGMARNTLYDAALTDH